MTKITLTPLRGLLAVAAALIVASCGGGGNDAGASAPPTPPTADCSSAGVAASDATAASSATVCMLTSEGEIVLELYPQQAPETVTNFLAYVNGGRYTNTVFHRVVKDVAVQGGGFTWDRQAVTVDAPIHLESGNGLSNTKGMLAMNRSVLSKDTANSQWFINTGDNSACLDKGNTGGGCDPAGYAVFGKVIAGLDTTVAAINGKPVDGNSRPRTDVYVYWAKQLKTAPVPAADCSAAAKAASDASTAPSTVCMLTTEGEIVIELYPAQAPISVANFLKYVNAGTYKKTLFHRVVKDFVVQGGGFNWDNTAVTTDAPITLESGNGLSNTKGMVAMARTSDPNSATSQWFVNNADNSACLDKGSTKSGCDANGYAVFGKMIYGLDTAIAAINVVAVDTNSKHTAQYLVHWAEQLK